MNPWWIWNRNDARSVERLWRFVDGEAVARAFPMVRPADGRSERQRITDAMDALRAASIQYVHEASLSPDPTLWQYIRHPDEIAGRRVATCLDVSLVGAGALLEAGIRPWVVIGQWPDGTAHAWIVAELEPPAAPDGRPQSLALPNAYVEPDVDLARWEAAHQPPDLLEAAGLLAALAATPDRFVPIDVTSLCRGYPEGGDVAPATPAHAEELGHELFGSVQHVWACDVAAWWNRRMLPPPPVPVHGVTVLRWLGSDDTEQRWSGRHLETGDDVVVRLAHDPVASRAADARRLAPSVGLVDVVSSSTTDRSAQVVERMMSGPNLGRRLAAGATYDELQVRSIGRQLALGLASAHASGLEHRDLTADVVWFDAMATARLGGFGRPTPRPEITSPYRAPETADGSWSTAADVFSLAATISAATTGRLPEVDGSDLAGVRQPLRDLLHRARAADPAGRPTAQQLALELEAPTVADPGDDAGVRVWAVARPAVFKIEVAGVGTGSGAVAHDRGIVVTNAHVVDGASTDQLVLVTADGTTVPARLLTHLGPMGIDLAFGIVDPEALGSPAPLEIAPMSDVRVGMRVWAAGSHRGTTVSLTEGIVGQIDGTIDGSANSHWIRHSADVNEGSSGGPLLDVSGRIVGLNTLSMRGMQGFNLALDPDVVAAQLARLLLDLDSAPDNRYCPGCARMSFVGGTCATCGWHPGVPPRRTLTKAPERIAAVLEALPLPQRLLGPRRATLQPADLQQMLVWPQGTTSTCTLAPPVAGRARISEQAARNLRAAASDHHQMARNALDERAAAGNAVDDPIASPALVAAATTVGAGAFLLHSFALQPAHTAANERPDSISLIQDVATETVQAYRLLMQLGPDARDSATTRQKWRDIVTGTLRPLGEHQRLGYQWFEQQRELLDAAHAVRERLDRDRSVDVKKRESDYVGLLVLRGYVDQMRARLVSIDGTRSALDAGITDLATRLGRIADDLQALETELRLATTHGGAT